jgi:hypothetical protein
MVLKRNLVDGGPQWPFKTTIARFSSYVEAASHPEPGGRHLADGVRRPSSQSRMRRFSSEKVSGSAE